MAYKKGGGRIAPDNKLFFLLWGVEQHVLVSFFAGGQHWQRGATNFLSAPASKIPSYATAVPGVV